MVLQVRAVPIRKDDEVQVVRGTYKVNSKHSSPGCCIEASLTVGLCRTAHIHAHHLHQFAAYLYKHELLQLQHLNGDVSFLVGP